MRMLTVTDSSNIDAVGYEPRSSTMRIRFKGGREHDYAGVSAIDFATLVSAPSVGSHFAANVRGKFTSVRVAPEPEAGAKLPDSP